METITIEIDAPTAKQFKQFSPETKKQFNLTVNIALKKMINDSAEKSHEAFINALSTEAKRNGLTQKILNDLLKADD